LDTKNLKYFVGVARYGSINQAAKAMYISQPQLSHIIKSIEEEVGFDLFQRTNQGVRLTRNGESFLSHCQIILEEMNSLDRFINQTHRQGSRLVVSMTRFSHTAVCFNDVACRHQDRESLFLRLRETDSMDVVDDVASGYSEIGVLHFSVSESESMLRNFENKRLRFQSIARFKPYVFLSAEHELLRDKEVRELDIRDLLNYGFVRYIGQYEDFFYHIATENGVVDLNDSAKIIYVNDRMEQIRLLAHSNFYTIGIPKYPDEGLHYKVANIPLRASNEHLRFGIITKENKRPTDIEAGKLTMAVRLGERWSRITYIVEMALALGLGVLLLDENPWFLLIFLLVGPTIHSCVTVWTRGGRDLIPVLKQAGIVALAYSVILALAVWLGSLDIISHEVQVFTGY